MAVNSKHLRSTTELSLIADIKPGLVGIGEPTAHSARLRTVLRVLSGLTEGAAEVVPTLSPGVLERLHMLHFFNWSLIDDQRRLLLTVVFDGPWETYIRAIVEDAGPFLDLIFCHCEGYAGNACSDGYAKFSAWVRSKQIASSFLYAGAPDLTSDDLVYLREFERRANLEPSHPAERQSAHSAERKPAIPARLIPEDDVPMADPKLLLVKLATLSGLRPLFPSNGLEQSSNDLFVLNRAAEFLTRDERASSGTGHLPPPLRAWVDELVKSSQPQPPGLAVAVTEEDLAQIQGNVIESYDQGTQSPSHGCMLLVAFRDRAAAAAFLADIKPRITAATAVADASKLHINLALTFAGLKAAGVGPELLAQFPHEFQEGLASRAGQLGDIGANHPDNWLEPAWNYPEAGSPARVELSSIDAIVTFQGRLDSKDARDHEWPYNPLRPAVEDVCGHWEKMGVRVLHVQSLRRHARSHFGLVDGISQPKLRSPHQPGGSPPKYDESVAPGEILLGYPNERGEVLGDPASPLWKNSTFLVVRKMSQDVAGFEDVVGKDEAVAKHLLGRRPNGDPLLEGGVMRNDFNYSGDPQGDKCPLHSHVRRANPRVHKVANGRTIRTPRIVRRGFPYGPATPESGTAAAGERGLIFMAHAASIAEQYEIIQRWINGGNSTGTYSANPDLIAGTFPPDSKRRLRWGTGCQAHEVAVPKQPLVRLEWGIYAFVPSLAAVEYLARSGAQPAAAPAKPIQARAPALVVDLQKLDVPVEGESPAQADERRARAKAGWKRVLEDPLHGAAARVVWGFVRARGGALRTPYGVLVGSRQGVLDVLGDASRFSVCEYWRRMENSLGGLYLGLDPKPSSASGARSPSKYERESSLPNQYMSEIDFRCVFGQASDFASAELAKLEAAGQPWDVRNLVGTVVAQVAGEWFGAPHPDFPALMNAAPEPPPSFELPRPPAQPDDLLPARCPADFQRISQYVFHPNPTDVLEQDAVRRGASVREAGDRFIRQRPGPSRLLDYLDGHDYAGDRHAALLGALNGFSAPTSANCVSVLFQWADSGALQRWQSWYAAELGASKKQGTSTPEQGLLNPEPGGALPNPGHPLVADVLSRMLARAIPDLLHRQATQETRLAPDVTVAHGDRVVISLGSAAEDARAVDPGGYWTLLFGGHRPGASYPPHACPGQQMALGTILGIAMAVLRDPRIANLAPFVFKFQAAPASR